MKYIKNFALTNEAVSDDTVISPNLTYVIDRRKLLKKNIGTDIPLQIALEGDDLVIKEKIVKSVLTFTCVEDGGISMTNYGSNAPSIQYSKNNSEWTNWNYSNIGMVAGDVVKMKGINTSTFSSSYSKFSKFNMTGKIAASGNIMSLIDGEVDGTKIIPCNCCFIALFKDCSSLVSAPELPATTLKPYCYGYYDSYNSRYLGMFRNCTGLTVAPALPATTMTNYCYATMFMGCSNLTAAPELPAETLANYCYISMFESCSKLETAPALPAMTIRDSSYMRMFKNCSKLAAAPALPATTLDTYCYCEMFLGCGTIAEAPTLPATTMKTSCYNSMFGYCGSLVTLPALPSMSLATSCYASMFYMSTKITTAPALPATTLTSSCYQGMFRGCTSLVNAPELPALTLVSSCYYNMFYGCSKLSQVKCLATTNVNTNNSTTSWLYGVANTGSFVKNVDASWTTTGVNGVPTGWTTSYSVRETIDTSTTHVSYSGNNYLTIAPSANNSALKITHVGNNAPVLYISSNHTDWYLYDGYGVNIGNGLYLMGKNTNGFSTSSSKYSKFVLRGGGNIAVSGSIMSLIDYENAITTIPNQYCFCNLFNGCSVLSSTPSLPATTLNNYCYSSMFNSCTSLTTSPSLPAQTLSTGCYASMFYNCTALTTMPTLSSTSLAMNCYESMFQRCTHLVNVSSLPATTLKYRSYNNMFNGCTGMTTAPTMSFTSFDMAGAPNTDYNVCRSMFEGCSSLSNVQTRLYPQTLVKNCYVYMFNGCTSLTTAPILPAKTLVDSCYYGMFQSCEALTSITVLATSISASNCTYEWISGIYNSGTFTIDVNMQSTWDEKSWNEGKPSSFNYVLDYTPQTYKSLSILADDVVAEATTTTIYYTYNTDGVNMDGETITDIPVAGTAVSEPFPANTGTSSVSITISYSGHGLSASTVITQAGVQEEPTALDYLTFTCQSQYGSISIMNENNYPDIQYKLNDGSWTQWDYSTLYLEENDVIKMKGTNPTGFNHPYDQSTYQSRSSRFKFSGYIGASGNIMSLIDGLPDGTKVIPCEECFSNLFYVSTYESPAGESLTSAPVLPATTLTSGCYHGMFSGCDRLTVAPELPASELAEYCYSGMFDGCTLLTESPILESGYLPKGCYSYMFSSCSSLAKITCFATNSAYSESEYDVPTYYWCSNVSSSGIFYKSEDASSSFWSTGDNGVPTNWTLTNGTEKYKYLTLTCVTGGSIQLLFNGTQYQSYEPYLEYKINDGEWEYYSFYSSPAQTISTSAGDVIKFRGDNPNGFSKAPEGEYGMPNYTKFVLNGTYNASGNIMSLVDGQKNGTKTVPAYCFYNLFSGEYTGNGGLITAPELPGTTLGDYCYFAMFANSFTLTTPPVLPATTLSNSCYAGMFGGCEYLTVAPELPAASLAERCYESMFNGCTSLLKSPQLNAPILVDSCYSYMFYGCTGLTEITCLAESISASSCTYQWIYGLTESYDNTFYCHPAVREAWYNKSSGDGIPQSWSTRSAVIDKDYLTFMVEYGDGTISLEQHGYDEASYSYPNIQYNFNNGGWVTYDLTNPSTISMTSGDKIQFKGINPNGLCREYEGQYGTYTACVSFVTQTSEGANFYLQCFGNIMSLIDGAKDGTKTIPNNRCFEHLFYNTKITTLPCLTATGLTEGCYSYMFANCSQLYDCGNVLYANTLAASCYSGMFSNCTNLYSGPELVAETLEPYCYSYMFYQCSNLTNVKCLAKEGIGEYESTSNWMNEVSYSGTFTKASSVSWPSGESGIPSGWTVQEV